MKFFVVSVFGDGVGMAARLSNEGHEVSLFLAVPNEKSDGVPGRGMVKRIYLGPLSTTNPYDFIKSKADPESIIVFDMTSGPKCNTGKAADKLREDGFAVIGASRFADAIELNRAYGNEIMELAGIPTPPTELFTSFEAALAFARTHPDYLVFKPHGNVGESKTIVAPDHDHFMADLEALSGNWSGKVEFELQAKVKGLEVSIEGWFDGTDWIDGLFNATVEEKRLMTGGLGGQTGCMGNVVWFWDELPDFVKKSLLKVGPLLKQVGYRGQIDLNTKGGYGLEWTPRMGFDATPTMTQLLQTDLGYLLSEVSHGRAPKMSVSKDYCAGVRLCVPPYPYEHKLEETAGTMVKIPQAIRPYFMPCDLEVEGPDFKIAGHEGILGVMCATGPDLKKLEKLVYERVKQVECQDLLYRTDILSYRAIKEIPKIRQGHLQ